MAKQLTDEEVAARIVQVYFKEVARLGFKRGLSLDEVINSYYYALSRLKQKCSEKKQLLEKVLKEEKEITTETKEELLPQAADALQ